MIHGHSTAYGLVSIVTGSSVHMSLFVTVPVVDSVMLTQ